MQNSIVPWLKQIGKTNTFAKCQWLHGENKSLQEHAISSIKDKLSEIFSCQTIMLENSNDWEQAAINLQHKDLFSPQKLVLLRSSTNKLNKNMRDSLQLIANAHGKNQQIIILSESLDKRQLKAKWLQEIINKIEFTTTNQLKPQEQISWIRIYATERSVNLRPDAITYLASLTQGNTADCKQCLDQLQMLYANEIITTKQIEVILSQQSNFQYYELSDTLLSGDTKLTQTMLQRFKNGQHEKMLLLWSVKQIVLQLHKFQHQLHQGHSSNQVLAKVWSSKQNLYRSALNRLSYSNLHKLLRATLEIDKCVKGVVEGDFWQHFNTICMVICSGNTKLLEAQSV